MPPSQKNTGKRGAERETPTTKKNNSFFEAFMSDIKKEGTVEDVYPARVIRNVGNGRVEVFFIGTHGAGVVEKAYIRGLFRGKGKHSVNIEVNSVVLVADTKIPGGAQYEIMCMLSRDHIRDLRRVMTLDDRILNFEATDGDALVNNEVDQLCGFDFTGGGEAVPDEDDEEAEIDVDAI
jgi:hypothetical protein